MSSIIIINNDNVGASNNNNNDNLQSGGTKTTSSFVHHGTATTDNLFMNDDNDDVSILVLGDGDFSWSLDLGRYLLFHHRMQQQQPNGDDDSSGDSCDSIHPPKQSSCRKKRRIIGTDPSNTTTSSVVLDNNNNSNTNYNVSHANRKQQYPYRYVLSVTGIDSEIEMRQKYPQSTSFIIPQLLKLNAYNTTTSNDNSHGLNSRVNIHVHYNVNAIVYDENEEHAVNNDNSNDFGGGGKGNIDVASNKQRNDDDDDITGNDNNNNNTQAIRYNNHNIVIFNHPHLGIEDCHLHCRFLYHLFHSVQNYWWKRDSNSKNDDNRCDDESGGGTKQASIKLFYLTLASGQYSRWNCEDAAKKFNMKLIQRCYFVPQPNRIIQYNNHTNNNNENLLPNNNKQSSMYHNNYYYEQRRHQTGKSFARRVNGPSETYIYTDSSDPTNTIPIDLPWFVTEQPRVDHCDSTTVDKNNNSTTAPTSLSLACPYCLKTFREERSVRNRIQSKHKNDSDSTIKEPRQSTINNHTIIKTKKLGEGCDEKTDDTKRDAMDDDEKKISTEHMIHTGTPKRYTCMYCFNNNDNNTFDQRTMTNATTTDTTAPCRVFDSQQALNDHIKAKHHALHTNVSPDWIAVPSTGTNKEKTDSDMSTKDDNSDNATKSAQVQLDELCCKICGLVYNSNNNQHNKSKYTKEQHLLEFIPTKKYSSSTNELNICRGGMYPCQFCSKMFPQKRAQLQHENFCNQRQQETNKQTT